MRRIEYADEDGRWMAAQGPFPLERNEDYEESASSASGDDFWHDFAHGISIDSPAPAPSTRFLTGFVTLSPSFSSTFLIPLPTFSCEVNRFSNTSQPVPRSFIRYVGKNLLREQPSDIERFRAR